MRLKNEVEEDMREIVFEEEALKRCYLLKREYKIPKIRMKDADINPLILERYQIYPVILER